ncbi:MULTISPECIES: hypothetical protein [Nostoc]|uniref:Uncharacterized protein n=1 Tax=Nostoc paludosum FACHB-159 TaxID=2692908 RepID=A0ABR8KIA4_9NOSO|nr:MULTISPECIES: hypothetical protein [Nostoc]MBD2682956.1 hypothetical protein [Nostoc sp. FACHB-857]MBD2739295.1 hypothetical protein [Nostoc paludosum FACHB-159]
MVVKLLIRCLPDSIVDTINAESLAELNRRQLIIWAEDVPVVESENEHSAYHLAARFQQVTPENLPEVLKAIAQIYTHYGNCLALTYLMEISAEYFGLIEKDKCTTT